MFQKTQLPLQSLKQPFQLCDYHTLPPQHMQFKNKKYTINIIGEILYLSVSPTSRRKIGGKRARITMYGRVTAVSQVHRYLSSLLILHNNLLAYSTVVLWPDPTLSRGKGSGDHWAKCYYSCDLSIVQQRRDLEEGGVWARDYKKVGRSSTWLHDIVLFYWVVQYQDCYSAQPRNRSMVTRPLSSWEGGVWARD